jgi:hypothetical protein
LRGFIATTAISVLITACSSSGSIDVGGGQEADPGTVDFPIFYVKRSIPVEVDDLRSQRSVAPDAQIDLYMRTRASPASTEINITGGITTDGLYDIKDVAISYDGKRVAFAMRGPIVSDDDRDPPTWNIWEFDVEAGVGPDNPHRVIRSDTTAEDGNDIAPQYLPDGRILFSSTRQRQSKAVLLDESKNGFEAQAEGAGESAFLLHVMNPDGSNIQQITFNQSHDLWPSVLLNGRVVFTRLDGSTGRGMHLYSANPDGSDVQLLYGARSHDTGTPGPDGDPTTIQFTRPREMQDGRILTLVRPYTDSEFGGDLVIIDARHYVEVDQPLETSSGAPGPAQQRATPARVSLVEGPSPGGRFRSAFPLWDGSNRLLVSWSLCRLLDNSQTPPAIVPCTSDRLDAPDFPTRYDTAPPLYSAFIYDPDDNTFRPLFEPQEGVMITDLVAAQPRLPPVPFIERVTASDDFDPALVGEGVGVIEIRNVYDFDGRLLNTNLGLQGVPPANTTAELAARSADQRPARFLRIEKAVSLGDPDLDGFPDIDDEAFGVGGNFMREIIGYAPIEPDGSVSVQVPANVAFVISIVDRNGRRLFPQHRAWLQVRPGEIRRCAGCHLPGGNDDRSHGRGYYSRDWKALVDVTSDLADPSWGSAGSGVPFPGTRPQTSANALPGDTMAQARARTSCISPDGCSRRPSVNVVFEDVWTDPNVATPAASFVHTYGSPGLSTPAPVRAGCIARWSSSCRVVINYVQHIQPIWTVERMINGENRTCTSCHAPPSVTGNMAPPAGQLDLSGDPSPEQQLHVVSYRELFFADTVEDFENGSLVPRQVEIVIGTDPDTGEPITELQPVAATTNPLIPGNARGSRFFICFSQDLACDSGDPAEAGHTVNHNGLLTPSELRLISEWVDIGAKYFNDPFADGVPLAN